MAETQRDLTTLLANIPDNTTGLVSPEDVRDSVVSALGGYGGMFVSAGSQVIGVALVKYTQWDTAWPEDGTNVITDLIGTHTDVAVAGDYMITISGYLTAATTLGIQFDIHVFANAVTTLCQTRMTMGAAADEVAFSASAIVTLAAATELDVHVRADTAASTIGLTGALTIKRVG